MNNVKRGDVRESDGKRFWFYGPKLANGERSEYWVTLEKYEELLQKSAEKLKKYNEKNADQLKVQAAQRYLKNREDRLEKAKHYYVQNKETINKKASEYGKKNAEHLKKTHNEYRAANRERARSWDKKYRDGNKVKIIDKLRERRRNDPMLRLKDAIRNSIRAYLGSKKTRRGSTFEIVGCTPDFLRGHLEKQFKDGMTWENYGPYWHVDHRIPLASGNSPEEIMGLSHWTNLQPLTAFENISKGAKIPVAGCQ
jgi:hypothetical protein